MMRTAEMSHVPHMPCAMLCTHAMCVSEIFSDELTIGQTSVLILTRARSMFCCLLTQCGSCTHT